MNIKQITILGAVTFAAQLALCGAEAAGSAQHALPQSSTEATSISGKVVETMDASGYTYVRVDTGTKKVWVASTRFPVKVGDSVATTQGMGMPNYHSKTLNRDFDLVYFTGSVTVNGTKSAAGDKSPELPKNHPPIASSSGAAKVDLSGIKPVKDGKTVGQIFADKVKLTGQQVKVRGKVVKYNPMVMGKNWVHIKDGTGAEGSNDLLITTSAATKVGDTVVVTGTVSTNKDFGAGYKYAVLIEDAKLVVE
ncbi:MAG: hypothetical protein NT154_39880 [Verrucomicrobia bacterium]|nr:hypothetical protein [Verrucomicrobiota bacterium]